MSDLISREVVMEALLAKMDAVEKPEVVLGLGCAMSVIKQLPAVEKKMGRWIVDKDDSRKWDRVRFYCSECNSWQTYGKTTCCPECGIRMENAHEYSENSH